MANDGTLPTQSYAIRDPEAFARNLARMLEEAGKAASAYLKPRESGKQPFEFGDSLTDIVRTLTKVADYWLAEPARTLEAQNRLYMQVHGPLDERAAAHDGDERRPLRHSRRQRQALPRRRVVDQPVFSISSSSST